jgi:hypothetical protein
MLGDVGVFDIAASDHTPMYSLALTQKTSVDRPSLWKTQTFASIAPISSTFSARFGMEADGISVFIQTGLFHKKDA